MIDCKNQGDLTLGLAKNRLPIAGRPQTKPKHLTFKYLYLLLQFLQFGIQKTDLYHGKYGVVKQKMQDKYLLVALGK